MLWFDVTISRKLAPRLHQAGAPRLEWRGRMAPGATTVLAATRSQVASRAFSSRIMKSASSSSSEQEPVGIVISRGPRREDRPIVWAYVYGPAPETPEKGTEIVSS